MRNILSSLIDSTKFRRARERQGLKQEALAEKAGISVKTLFNVENGKQVDDQTIIILAIALKQPLDSFYKDPPPIVLHEARQIGEALQIAVEAGMNAAARVLEHPNSGPRAETHHQKGNPLDKTKEVDLASGEAIRDVLIAASKIKDHVLAEGFHLVTEEVPPQWISGQRGSSVRRWLITLDEVDDTASALTGLGGSILAAAYLQSFGWVAAVIGDLARRRIYFRVTGSEPAALQLNPRRVGELVPDPSRILALPQGSMVPIGHSSVSSLRGARVCMYLGKPERVTMAAELGRRLLAVEDPMGQSIGSIHSHGGSMGPVLVADGSIDASIEYSKGFKRIDLLPGIFFAAGAKATVVGLDGLPYHFGIDEQVEDIIDFGQRSPETPGGTTSSAMESPSQRFERLRQCFVVAATSELADEIVERLGGASTPSKGGVK